MYEEQVLQWSTGVDMDICFEYLNKTVNLIVSMGLMLICSQKLCRESISFELSHRYKHYEIKFWLQVFVCVYFDTAFHLWSCVAI